MGSAASTGVAEALAKASPDEVTAALAGMSEESMQKIRSALEGVKSKSAVFVTVDIKEDRVDDFLKAMEDDVTKSRDEKLDAGCLRFDLLKNRDNPNRFVFYEAYTDDDAAAAHKKTSHYQSWADFKASGGVENQTVVKVETASLPGTWAFQASPRRPGDVQPKCAVIVTVEIEPERIEAFLKVMQEDATKSRDPAVDPGCIRFDLLRDRDNANTFVFYEAYTDDDAAVNHKTTDHYKGWAEFKAAGGVVNQTVDKVAADLIPGGWAFQAS